ncbi:pentatricopeptide repeat-containing protein At1g28690, mitochondrial [Nymphaea colorata]|nr:pentatricopeptide repeat-containing protein At1g28690, mitochondrial [Nymphaea colorata]
MRFLLKSLVRKLHLLLNKGFLTDSIETASFVVHQRCRFHHHLARSSTDVCSILQDFIYSDAPSHGIFLHSFVLKAGLQWNSALCTKLVLLYLKSGYLGCAHQLFEEMPRRAVSSWNAMIAAYFKQRNLDKSLELVYQMRESLELFDGFTYSCILRLSAGLRNLGIGRQVHCRILRCKVDCDRVLITGLVDMYAKNGKIEYARRLFDDVSEKNIVCSTAMISGYMKCGRVNDAEEIFNAVTERDVVVWNAMIEGYSLLVDNASRALIAFIEMQQAGLCPTVSTFASLIGACISLSALEQGQQIHAHVIKNHLWVDVRSGSALVDMYAKCGRIEDSRKVFDRMHHRNVITWTAMIDGYGKNGNVDESLHLFQNMKMLKVIPNYVTFLSVLSACGHGGLVDEGWEIFSSMKRDYGLSPRVEHYACMVDLIGRTGSLDEAVKFIELMPILPNEDVWGALLGASRLHGDVAMAAIAAKELFKLNSCKPGAYVALSNAYAAAGRWEGVHIVRELMKDSGVSKNAGCSWVETEEGLQTFHVG